MAQTPEEKPQPITPSRSTKRRGRPARALKEDNSAKRRLWLIIALVTLALVGIASGVGYYLNRVAPVVVVTQTPTPSAAKWKLALPLQVNGYSRDAADGASPVTGPDKVTTVTAPYSKDGKQQLIILMGRPYVDLKSFMEAANMNVVVPVDDALCGISGDNNLEGCAIMSDDTAILVMSMGDPTRSELVVLAKAVAEQVTR